jgi:amidohydrolase
MSNFWVEEAKKILPQAVEWRRTIHQHPELGLQLPHTVAVVRDALMDLDALTFDTGPSTCGMIVTIQGSKTVAGTTPRVVLLRGDMDALPMPEKTGLPFASTISQRMHACGHDAHTSMLIAATRILYANRSRLNGVVKLMFQPGEESYFGAREMIKDGLLDKAPVPQAAFAMHVSPALASGIIGGKPGPQMASADMFVIVVNGRGVLRAALAFKF